MKKGLLFGSLILLTLICYFYDFQEDCPYPSYTESPLKGVKAFHNDWENGVKWAEHEEKAILLWFTGHACISSRYMEEMLLTEETVFQKIKKDFIVICLYVDDRTKLSKARLWEYKQFKKRVSTVGDENATFQIERFQSNRLPEFHIMSSDGNDIIEEFNYDSIKTSQEIDSVLERSLLIFNNKLPRN